MPWLKYIDSPTDLKQVPLKELPNLAREAREFLIETVSKTGGHLGTSLGALELNIALHYVLDSPHDKIVWDVGHQTYVHKMLTGRRDKLHTLRQPGGLSGFPNPTESAHDHFIVAHAGTAISQALGFATARDMLGGTERVVAVVGDGSLTTGLSYEALNNAGQLKHPMLIVLNDNKMSIAKNVGGMSKYLNKVITNPIYNRVRDEVEHMLDNFPRLRRLATNGLEGLKHVLVPGMLFEELGLRYFGPVDGHDVVGLVNILKQVVKVNDVVLLHIVTEKGKGYAFAEQDEEKFHGVTPFEVATGCKITGAVEKATIPQGLAYTKAFGNALLTLARQDPRIVAITAAMPSGTGLVSFQQEFPERFFDVGIAEQHAVTFAGAMAKRGLKPVCAIYSTFLQRSQDQLIHDVSLQHANVTLALDRAGLVGADGATHNGVFDISYLGHIPRAVIAAPKDEGEMLRMLELGIAYSDLFTLRYPRGTIPVEFPARKESFAIGEGEMLVTGEDVALVTLGSMVQPCLRAASLLEERGVRAAVCNMRFAQPLDVRLLLGLVKRVPLLCTVEEHGLTGGFGSKVLEALERENVKDVRVKRLALPDEFVEHGKRETLLAEHGLSPEKIAERILAERVEWKRSVL